VSFFGKKLKDNEEASRPVLESDARKLSAENPETFKM
jgi:hypothetical protein